MRWIISKTTNRSQPLRFPPEGNISIRTNCYQSLCVLRLALLARRISRLSSCIADVHRILFSSGNLSFGSYFVPGNFVKSSSDILAVKACGGRTPAPTRAASRDSIPFIPQSSGREAIRLNVRRSRSKSSSHKLESTTVWLRMPYHEESGSLMSRSKSCRVYHVGRHAYFAVQPQQIWWGRRNVSTCQESSQVLILLGWKEASCMECSSTFLRGDNTTGWVLR